MLANKLSKEVVTITKGLLVVEEFLEGDKKFPRLVGGLPTLILCAFLFRYYFVVFSIMCANTIIVDLSLGF